MINFSYLIESALHILDEAFDLPKVVDPYRIEPSGKNTYITIPSLNIQIGINTSKAGNWDIGFKGTKGYELTGEYNLKKLPMIFAVLNDYMKKKFIKPKSISFIAKSEDDGKDSYSFSKETHAILSKDIDDFLSSMDKNDIIHYSFKELSDICTEVKLNKYHSVPVELSNTFKEAVFDFYDEDVPKDVRKAMVKFLDDLGNVKSSDIEEHNRRSSIYIKLVSRYWPQYKATVTGNRVVLKLR